MATQNGPRIQPQDVPRHTLVWLKWLTTVVPAGAVFLYETVRHDFLERLVPTAYGNLLVGLLTLALAYGFSTVVFGIVERLQRQALARSREITTLNAMMQERERLSRELHDGLAQLVAYLLVRIDTVADLVADGRRTEAVAELERLRGVADDLYADIRESITDLRTPVARHALLPALATYLEEFEERHGISVELRADPRVERFSPLAEFHLFRIAQEALANVRKHAGASHAWVTFIQSRPNTCEMVVDDDGRGFEPDASTRTTQHTFGLMTMRERAESLGGTFQITRRPGGGTRVVVSVPCGATTMEVVSDDDPSVAR